MSEIPKDIAQIVAVFVECIFYGVYLVTFGASLRITAISPPGTSFASRLYQHRWMLVIVLSMFVILTLNLVLGFVRIVTFLHHDNIGSGEPGQVWINVFKPITVQLEITIADYVLIYRCWIVYNKLRRVLVFPLILYIITVVCMVLATIFQVRLQNGDTSHTNAVRLIKAWFVFWLSTISLNIYATSMIVLRIWRVESRSRGRNTLAPLYVTPHPSRLQTAMKAVIESGLLYTITSIISTATMSNSQFITTAIGIQTTGIAFNLILIRVNPNNAEHTTLGHAMSTGINFAPASGVRSSAHVLSSRLGGDSEIPTDQYDINLKVITASEPQTEDVENKH